MNEAKETLSKAQALSADFAKAQQNAQHLLSE